MQVPDFGGTRRTKLKYKAMNKFIKLWILAASVFAFAACTAEEALQIQKPYEYDEQYYANIREYKQNLDDHCLSFVYYAAYAPLEGVTGYKDPASWGERFRGLPDSLDICNLWMGIPSDDPTADNYMPVAYKDMRYVQEKLGTRFVSHADASQPKRTVEGVEFVFQDDENPLTEEQEKAVVKAYGKALVDQVLKYDIDGIDVDYEPNCDFWNQPKYILLLAQTINEYFGPDGQYPEKILMIDYYGHGSYLNAAGEELDKCVDYFIRQAYTQGFSEHSQARLQSNYDQIAGCCADPKKFIVCENFGNMYENGGSPFNDYNNQPMYTIGGKRMYSLEGMARWNPTQGEKGGFGAFYVDRDYYSATRIPYYNFRRCIQIANPAIY